MKKRVLVLVLICSSFLYAQSAFKVEKKVFGQTPCGQNVNLYTLTNAKGIKVGLMDFGAALVSAVVPDSKGQFADIVLGYNNFNGYLCENPYFGGIVGRFGNRIANGRFTIDGVNISSIQTITASISTAASRVSTAWSGKANRLKMKKASA